MSELVGRKLDKYELEELLGQGGMAAVYRSHHPQLDLPVAIKVLPHVLGQNTTLLARFQREARTIAALNHPGIVRIFDIDEADDVVYMVMELLPGGTLEQRIRAGGLDRTWSADIIVQVAGALDYAHRHGVIHRDIKPSNILLNAEGRPILADFGIARLVRDAVEAPGGGDPGRDPTLTSVGMVLGTPAYMAPEQLAGQPVDARSDIYALGVVLYQLLTGRAPFTGDTMTVVSGHLTREPPPLREYVPDIPPLLEAVVLQTLAKNPEHRFKSAGVFATALRNAAEELEPGVVQVSSAARRSPPPAAFVAPAQPAIPAPTTLPAQLRARPGTGRAILIGVAVLLILALLARTWEVVGALAILAGFVVLVFAVLRRLPASPGRPPAEPEPQAPLLDTAVQPLPPNAVTGAVTSAPVPASVPPAQGTPAPDSPVPHAPATEAARPAGPQEPPTLTADPLAATAAISVAEGETLAEPRPEAAAPPPPIAPDERPADTPESAGA
ncbi:MAG TPA: protein kinase [Roseiflexaceae bacterium]|nr:protein kinase [Roseiflexaceae bacterium]